MSAIHRNLVSLEMLADDLADELGLIEISDDKYVTANYCRLLQQYHQHSLCLEASAIELTGREFIRFNGKARRKFSFDQQKCIESAKSFIGLCYSVLSGYQ